MQVFFPICFSLSQYNYTESMCDKHITFTYEWIPNGNLVETRTRENHCSKATKETQQECTWSLFNDFFVNFELIITHWFVNYFLETTHPHRLFCL